jgi:2Fe-2S ferredoxin
LIEEKNADEEAMLSEAFHVKNNSRLGCQIQINEKLDGFQFELAPE